MPSAHESGSRNSVALVFGVVAGITALYLISGGPAMYCLNKRGLVSPTMFHVLDAAYTPTGWLYERCDPYREYLNWWGWKAKGR